MATESRVETSGVRLERVGVRSDLEEVLDAYDADRDDLYGFALATTRSTPAAEELVQEAFLRLIQEVRLGRHPANTRAWLFRVCANLARSRFRRQAVAARWRGLFRADGEVDGPEVGVVKDERRERVRAALGVLPDEARVALMLSAEGFSGEAIARMLGRSEGSTRTLLWRARSRLRSQLADEEGSR